MAATLEEIKSYMHAEGEADETVAPFVDMARAYLAGAGVREAEVRESAAYDLALKALTLHYYDNRGGAAVPEGLNRLVTQLQYARAVIGEREAAVSDSDTGEEESP